jgi:hypothetical protein
MDEIPRMEWVDWREKYPTALVFLKDKELGIYHKESNMWFEWWDGFADGAAWHNKENGLWLART